jgi:hypothetical protein
MKKLALGALLVGLLAACGGDDGHNGKIMPIDGGADSTGPMTCNPLTQAGCAAGEKCTWLIDATMPQYVGHIGCAPDGAVAVDGACTYGAAGATGYDDCAKGSVCSQYRTPGNAGICKQLCDQQGGTPACDANHVCVTYSGLFSSGSTDPAAAGVCDKACDPLTDNDFDGSGTIDTKTTDTCGSAANVGCYGVPSGGVPPATGWSCTGDVNAMVAQPTGLRHRVQCIDGNMCSDSGTIYINSCNQGYLPLLRESTATSTAICTALCKPANCSTGNCGNQGIARQGVAGDACNLNDRMGTFQAAAVRTSTNANMPSFETGGEHCRYIWSFEIDDQGNFLRSPTSDTVGFCFDHSKYQWDSNADDTPDTDYPSCALLASGSSTATDPLKPLEYWGASDLGCEDSTTAGLATGKKLSATMVEKMRKANLPRPLYHSVMR